MAGIANRLVSSASRPLRLRMRPDLITRQQCYQGRRYWVVKDPISLTYHRFEEEEFALLEMLDGHSSAEQLQGRFERRFSPQKITLQELHQFVGMLYRSALVVSDASGQGRQLRERGVQTARRRRLTALTNILAIRFKGFDPDRLLSWLEPQLGWLFSLPVVLLGLMSVAGALLLLGAQFDAFRARLPQFHEFFAVHNWLWLAATLAVTKACHELGHGLACKRLGGECHEMGVMLLVLTPCLYCNVSDSWMLPSKWQRAAIGAAGMYVELVIASIATFLWWFTQPGLLHYLCLNLMFVCSVSTLLFNANPLLRYDGYYILSDLVEIPNLRQKASAILHRKLGKWLLGLPEPHDPFLPQRRPALFACYSVAAAVYRWLVVLSIFWLLYHLFEPQGLKVVGQIIACLALYGLVVQPLWQLAKFFYIPGRWDSVDQARMFASLAVIAVALGGAALVPLPHCVSGNLHIQPRGAAAVYVDVPGTLQTIHVAADQPVQAGQILLTLENVDQWLALAQLEGRRAQEAALLESLVQGDLEGDEGAGLEIDRVKESIAALDQQIRKRVEDAERLILKAPVSGTVFPAPDRPADPPGAEQLPSWSGSPLQPHNVGAFLPEGTLVCQVGDPSRLEAVLVIDQTDIEFVRPGQKVEIVLDSLPGRQFSSTVAQISKMEMESSPRSLSSKSGGRLATRTDSAGRQRPLSTSFQVSAPVDDPEGLIRVGASGRGKIHVGYQPMGRRVWRQLCRTFRFEM